MYYAVLLIAFVISGSTLASGFYIYLKKKKENVKKFRKVAKISLSAYGVLMVSFLIFTIQDIANAAPLANSEIGMGFIAAAISTGLATIGAGYAVGAVGSSALGAVSEDPNILGKTLIFVGLAEGIAIYGLIVSIMILGRL